MPINPAIAMGVQPLQLPDPLAQYGKIAAIQQAQNQNALASYQLGAARREEAAQNALSDAYRAAYDPTTGGYDINKLRGAIISAGAGARLPGIEKQFGEIKVQQLTQQKLEGNIAKNKSDLIDASLKQSRSFLDTIDPSSPDAADQYRRWHKANHSDPILGPVLAARGITAEQSNAMIEQAIQQGKLPQLIAQSMLGTEEFMRQNKPTTQVINQGGQQQVVQIPGLGGAPTSVGTYKDVPLPPDVEQQRARLASAGASKNITQVNAYTPASETAQKEYISAVSDERKSLRNAPDALKNIDAAKKLIPSASAFMGKGGEPLLAAASFLNNRLGLAINTQGVTDATVLRTRLFEGILDNLKKLDSQPSQEQQRVLSQAVGNLGTDPAALGQILDRISETVQDRVARYNLDVSEAERRGIKFPFKPQIDLAIPGAQKSQEPSSVRSQADAIIRGGR